MLTLYLAYTNIEIVTYTLGKTSYKYIREFKKFLSQCHVQKHFFVFHIKAV